MRLPHYRLFILGAGFSAPAGIPLAHDLLARVRQQVRAFHQYQAGWDGPLEREIEEWRELYPGKPLDLELVLAYSHRKHYLRLLGSDEYFAHGSRSVVAARTAIQEVLTSSTPVDTPEVYREFARRLCPRDVVLTFNYDTLLEQALDDVGVPYSLTPEWWLRDDPPEPRYVDLLKLHGSVDWYDRSFHDSQVKWHADQGHQVPDDDPIFGPSPSIPSEALARGPVEVYGSKIVPRVSRVPDHRTHFPIRARYASVVPFILPLAYDKLLGNDAILDLWENLHRTQDAFSSITVIGYSMPPHDSYAYEALGRLLVEYQQGGDETVWEHRRVPIQIVTLADSIEDSTSGMPFLDSGKVRVWNRGFGSAAIDWLDWGDGASK